MSNQPYTTEQPDRRKVEVESAEVQGSGTVPVYEADPTRLDLSTEFPETESRAQMDEVVGPDHPAAVIVPPEGRGSHPRLGVSAPTADELLAAGEADEATGVEDGKVVTSSEAAERGDGDKS